MVIVVRLASVAAAEPAPDVAGAKARFAAGTSYFKDQRYREAVVEFLEAYRISQATDLLYNVAVCYEALHDAGRATIYFQRYLEARVNGPERDEIEKSLYRLSSHVARLVVHVPSGVAVTVDGIAAELPPPTPLPLSEGRHRVVATRASGAAVAVDVELAGGLSKEVTLDPLESRSTNGRAASRRRWLWPVVGSAAAVVVVAVVAAVVLSVAGPDYRAQGTTFCAGSPGCHVIRF